MAASVAYSSWLRAGKPYRLMRPAKALQAELRRHGLTVYDYPNDDHLKASKPEDHTPFSATGWPVKSAVGVGHALDVMPRADTAAARRDNGAIARTLIAARNAGRPEVAWIKYLNWTDEQGVCRQESWKPNHVTVSSTDKGHVHISGRSDCDDDPRADGYDPLTPATTGAATVTYDLSATHNPTWGDGVERSLGRLIWEGWDRDTTRFDYYAANFPNSLPAAITRVAADVKANRVALEALTTALNRGGGSVDSASVIAHMDLLAAAEIAREQQLLARIAELEAAAVANLSQAELDKLHL